MAMKIESPVETLIGAGVIAIAVGFAVYANQSGGGGGVSSGAYPVVGYFSSAVGVAPGTDVRVAGVKVGTVSSAELDARTYEAKVTLSIREGVSLPIDTLAKVDAEGLLGGSFIALEPGASDEAMAAGDEFEFTQGALSLTTLISRVIAGGGSDDAGGSAGGAATSPE